MDASLVLEDFIYNLSFKISFIVVFFRMVHNEKIFRSPSVKYWTFSEGPTLSDLFPVRVIS